MATESGAGVLTTDSGLNLYRRRHGNFLALDSSDGKTLWHAGSGSHIESSPITYELDGRQYVLTSSGGVMFAWALPGAMSVEDVLPFSACSAVFLRDLCG